MNQIYKLREELFYLKYRLAEANVARKEAEEKANIYKCLYEEMKRNCPKKEPTAISSKS